MSIASRIQKETLKWTEKDMDILRSYAVHAITGVAADVTSAPDVIAERAFAIAEAMMIEHDKQKVRSIKIAATNPGI